MSQTNFLIGRGELLTHEIKGPRKWQREVQLLNMEKVTISSKNDTPADST